MAKDKPPKRRGCAGCLVWIIVGIVAFIFLTVVFYDPDNADSGRDTSNDDVEVAEEVEQENESEIDEEQESEDVIGDEVEEQVVVEENEEQDEIEEEVEEDGVEEDVFKHEIIEGYDFYTIVIFRGNDEDALLRNFSVAGTDFLKENHNEINNDVILRLATYMRDEYGNDTLRIVAHVWYNQDTIERINYDNWPQLIASGLYDTADGVSIHNFISRNAEQGQKIPDGEVPDVYRYGIGEEYDPE